MLVPGLAVVTVDDGFHAGDGFLELLDFVELQVGVLHDLVDDSGGAGTVDGEVGDGGDGEGHVGGSDGTFDHTGLAVDGEAIESNAIGGGHNDDSAAVSSFKSVVLPEGDLEIVGEGVFTLPDGAEITVGEGATLTFSAPVYLKGGLNKNGKGQVFFEKILRSEADPLSLTKTTGFGGLFRVAQGEAVIDCPVEGLRLCSYSTERADMPLLILADDAVIVTNSYVHAVYNDKEALTLGYGRVVQNGGTVDMTRGGSISSVPYTMSLYVDGESSITVNGGSFSMPVSGDYQCFFNYNQFAPIWQSGGGTNTIVVNGGTVTLGVYLWTATQSNAHNAIELNGGRLTSRYLRQEAGYFDFRLNGGEFYQPLWGTSYEVPKAPGNWTENLDRFNVSISGEVCFIQDTAGNESKFRCKVTGSGKIRQAGVASISFVDSSFSGDYAVEKGSLKIGSGMLPLSADAKLSVDSGAKVILDYEGSADINSIEIAGKLRRAGQYSADSDPHGGRFGGYFEGIGVLNALTGAEVRGMSVTVR